MTGFTICLDIRSYWECNGGLERFGYPISPVMNETIEGKTYMVQYFERRRIEIHPENKPPYNILLGLLGREILNMPGGGPLAGTSWQWSKLSDPTQAVDINDPANYTLTFVDASNLSMKADCNQVRGSYSLGTDHTMTITPGPSTRVACPPGSRGDEFVKKLGAVAIYSLQNNTLLLELPADGGTLQFERQ